MFVIRVAGNVARPSQIGSVEFAVQRLGVRLVVVLGHTRCGAVEAKLEHLRSSEPDASQNLLANVEPIQLSVERLLATELTHDTDSLMRDAVRANVRGCADRLRYGSRILAESIARDQFMVVGAEYSLESGTVDFFDGLQVSV